MIDNDNEPMYVTEDGKYLVFETNGWEYDIPMRDLETLKGFNDWFYHMNEKAWFKPSHRKFMIEVCEKRFGYKYDGKYND